MLADFGAGRNPRWSWRHLVIVPGEQQTKPQFQNAWPFQTSRQASLKRGQGGAFSSRVQTDSLNNPLRPVQKNYFQKWPIVCGVLVREVGHWKIWAGWKKNWPPPQGAWLEPGLNWPRSQKNVHPRELLKDFSCNSGFLCLFAFCIFVCRDFQGRMLCFPLASGAGPGFSGGWCKSFDSLGPPPPLQISLSSGPPGSWSNGNWALLAVNQSIGQLRFFKKMGRKGPPISVFGDCTLHFHFLDQVFPAPPGENFRYVNSVLIYILIWCWAHENSERCEFVFLFFLLQKSQKFDKTLGGKSRTKMHNYLS